jgi:hypothetical protein
MDTDLLGLHDGKNNGASEKLDPAQSEPQQVLANKGGTDGSPQLITIQCGLEIINPQAPPASVIGVEGFIDWGISGSSHKARFDWLQGCAFSLAATSFKLRAKLRTQVVPGTNVFAKATVAYDPKPCIPMQWSSDYTTLDGNANVVLDIPLWATHGLLIARPFDAILSRSIRLELLTFNNLPRYEVRPGDCTESNRFPLSFDVQKIRITNLTDGRATASIIWRLAL